MATSIEAKALKAQAEANNNIANQALHMVANRLMQEQGLEQAANGLTPDSVKFHPEYKAAKAVYDKSFNDLRNVNAWFTKTFKKEYAAERKARYQ